MLSETDIENASMVLAKCAAYDPWFPKPEGEQAQATIQAWATTFSGREREDLLGGVDLWYAHHGAGEKVLPADIRKESASHRESVRMRLSIDQQETYAQACAALKLEARSAGRKPPVIPMPRVPLPENVTDAEALSEEQRAELSRLNSMKTELNRLELD